MFVRALTSLFAGLLVAASLAQAGETPVLKAEAAAISEAYRTNDAYADEKYTDRRIQVTGLVNRVQGFKKYGVRGYLLTVHSVRDTQVSVLDLPLAFEFSSPQALAAGRSRLAKLKVNEGVLVEGVCRGKRVVDVEEVILFEDCKILEAKPAAK
jgi:hypothetical protein